MRDDFTQAVKNIIARRVGYRCSNPFCRTLTSGPQLDSSGTVNVGFAAHISAAAPGGPRYDPSLTPKQRCTPENGIWLCGKDAKLVDSDPQYYTCELLQQWKFRAEELARVEIESGVIGPPKEISNEQGREFYFDRIITSHTDYLWGKIASGEFAENAFWRLASYPEYYVALRIEKRKLKDLINAVSVNEGYGWSFPLINDDDSGIFPEGFESAYGPRQYYQGFRIYTSALFVWESLLKEDFLNSSKDQILDWPLAIANITRMFLFCRNLYAKVLDENTIVHLNISLYGMRNRSLDTFDPAIMRGFGNFVCSYPEIFVQKILTVRGLIDNAQEHAIDCIKDIFLEFNDNRIKTETIRAHQLRLIPAETLKYTKL